MLQAARRLHDKLTFLFKLRHAMRPNVRLAAQLALVDLMPPEYWR